MNMTIEQYKKKLEDERAVMLSYLDKKMGTEDWHGVADAAMDLRDIDSELKVIKMLGDKCLE